MLPTYQWNTSYFFNGCHRDETCFPDQTTQRVTGYHVLVEDVSGYACFATIGVLTMEAIYRKR